MEMYIHYNSLPEGKTLTDVVGELNEVLEDVGSVCGGEAGRIDLDLEDERANPKHAQVAVKANLPRVEFPRHTAVEIGGLDMGVYESVML